MSTKPDHREIPNNLPKGRSTDHTYFNAMKLEVKEKNGEESQKNQYNGIQDTRERKEGAFTEMRCVSLLESQIIRIF